GRVRPGIEQLVGCFLNLAALRIDVGGHPTFGELLRRARDATLGAYANQDVPFERVLEARARGRLAVSRTPLFEVLLNMHEFEEHLALPGLEAEILPSPPPEPLFDLTLYFRHGPRGLELTLTGNADLLGEERMVEMLAQIRAVLEQAAASPERAIDDFSLVTDGIRVRLPDPAATLDRAWHGAVHERVSAQAWHTPARLAVHSADERWTYGELEAASNRLAPALHAAGPEPVPGARHPRRAESRCGIYDPRSRLSRRAFGRCGGSRAAARMDRDRRGTPVVPPTRVRPHR